MRLAVRVLRSSGVAVCAYIPPGEAGEALNRLTHSRLYSRWPRRKWGATLAALFGTVAAALASSSCLADPPTDIRFADAPMMVLQTGHAMAVTAAAWTPDSRYVVTGARDRQLMLWDTHGVVVDRAQLPVGWAQTTIIDDIVVDPDGKGAIAVAEVSAPDWVRFTAYHWRFGRSPQVDSKLPASVSLHYIGTDDRPPFQLPSPDRRFTLVQLSRDVCGGYGGLGDPACHLRPSVLTIVPASGAAAGKIALVGQTGTADDAVNNLLANYGRPGLVDPTGKNWDVSAADNISFSISSGGNVSAAASPRSSRVWAFASDGRLAARVVEGAVNLVQSASHPSALSCELLVFDFNRGVFLDPVLLDPSYDRIDWIGPRTLMATSSFMAIQALRLDVDPYRVSWSKPMLCDPVPVDSAGTVVSAGLANCKTQAPHPWCPFADPVTGGELDCAPPPTPSVRDGLALVRADGACRPLNSDTPLPFRQPCGVLPGERIAPTGPLPGLGASADLALATDGTRVWDIASGRLNTSLQRLAPIDQPGLLAAGGRVLLARDTSMVDDLVLGAWDLTAGRQILTFTTTLDNASGPPRQTLENADVYLYAVSADGSLVALQQPITNGRTQSYSVSTGKPAGPAINLPAAAEAFGFHPTEPLFWSQSRDGALSLHSQATGATLFTFYTLAGPHFFAVDPAGRYDTDLPPDSRDIRWLVPDAPLQSLAPQTFMRGFYTPGLIRNAFDCVGAETTPRCRQAFRPVPDLAKLNRVLPVIREIKVDESAGTLSVDVAEGTDPNAANHRTRSGVYDLRVFRDGKLIGEWPEPSLAADAAGDDVEAWRRETAVPGATSENLARHAFAVSMPSDNGTRPVVFSAYAFNEDRVKGETFSLRYVRTVAPKPRPRRAYVIAIGVNAYAQLPDHSLNFAVDDAEAVVGALTTIPGYEVIPVALTAEQGKPSAATKSVIRSVLALLAGQEGGNRATLAAAGIDASRLDRATPDDLVILAFSGHGWADDRGSFYLLPSDALLPDAASKRALASLVSSAELTAWLRGVDAGEMAMIIDACHSAASVTADGFRPGPMGDPGLGQLAFDKGIRILAATQADSVAMESAQLHGGLLTYALIHDGLGDSQHPPKADHSAAGAVHLDALLQYALKAMPGLEEKTQPGHRNLLVTSARTPMLVSRQAPPAAPPIQQPSLFDFTGVPSPASILPPSRSPS